MPSIKKLKDKGFWVSHHFYWQSLIHYFVASARFRSFTFFSACDPAIDLGGMLDENKSDINKLLPQQFVPLTLNVNATNVDLDIIKESGLDYPLIVKPNIGFRGYKVVKVNDEKQLIGFLKKQDEKREWLIQEYIDLNREYSLLFYRYPGTDISGITSLIEKIYPTVIGDGKSKLRTLIDNYINPFLERSIIENQFSTEELEDIPDHGANIILDTIGNYSRGSKFVTLMDDINDELIEATSTFFKDVEGLDFFRMDFKADNLKDYVEGRFGILEINGTKSEPLHIYDPKYNFLDRIKIIRKHWAILREIVKARVEHSSYVFPSTRYGLKALFAIKRLVK